MSRIEIIGGRADVQIKDFHCPECKTVRPPFGFEMNGGDLGILGLVQYMTVFCGAEVKEISITAKDGVGREIIRPAGTCGAILSVMLVMWKPPMDPAMVKALQDALRRGPLKPGEAA